MKSLFFFDDYRAFLKEKIKSLPKEGHGVVGKLAVHMGVHPSLVSQILKGDKQLTQDQAFALTDFFALSALESEYFLLLVNLDRAGTSRLRAFLQTKLEAIRTQSTELSKRLESKQILSDNAKGIFYSDWAHSAVRQLTAIDRFGSVDAIANALDMHSKEVRRVLEFLVEHGLCKQENGRYSVGPQSTHLPASSPWVKVHHRNWREQAVAAMSRTDPEALFYTCPLTMGEQDSGKVRELAIRFIEEVNKVVDPSPSERLYCLNIDWFPGNKR
ncbi:MAG: TIGR02147 family protein [Bdellovibrionota bacterium]